MQRSTVISLVSFLVVGVTASALTQGIMHWRQTTDATKQLQFHHLRVDCVSYTLYESLTFKKPEVGLKSGKYDADQLPFYTVNFKARQELVSVLPGCRVIMEDPRAFEKVTEEVSGYLPALQAQAQAPATQSAPIKKK